VGANVTTLAPGDRVLGMTNPENTFSLASIRGLGNLSGGIDLPGHTMFGGYAQFVSRPESYWIKVRPDLDLDQGAAVIATTRHPGKTSIRAPPRCGRAPPPTASSPTDLTCG
jgi:NADPH:quinone reductase-like Zn-dependent oxidoreductase